MSCKLFAGMIAPSNTVMYGLSHLNTYAFAHIFWSETRLYTALLMGATMVMIMLGFMSGEYMDKKANIGIFSTSIMVFLRTLWLVRSQAAVQDV